MTLRGLLKGTAAGLFILSLPVLFGTLSLRWLWADTSWYRAGFAKYGVSERTGISPTELGRVADDMSSYLLFQSDNIDIPVRIGNQTVPLFNEREIKHMEDVRSLLGRFYTLLTISAGYILFYLVGSRFWSNGDYWGSLGRKLRWGGGITVGLFGLLGLLSFLDFEQLWLRFHLIAFDNDLWMLDPTKDRLIMMAPEGLWYDSAIRFAQATISQALLAIVVGTVLVRRRTAIGREPVVRSGH